MGSPIQSIRVFIGAKDYHQSRSFYKDWGFEEMVTSEKMSYFTRDGFGFYLQDQYDKHWLENTMIFLEVESLSDYWEKLRSKKLDEKYPSVKLVEPTSFEWGSEGFIYDPSGVLWHIGQFT